MAAGRTLVFRLALAAAIFAQCATATLTTRQRCLKHRFKVRITLYFTTAEDLSDERVQNAIQFGLDATKRFPPANSIAEYADYFEAVYPSASDRQRYIEEIVTAGTPSYGHQVLATLLRIGRAQTVWTTNFDEMIEQAYSALPGVGSRLNTVALEQSDSMLQWLNENRWPLLVKLHGDFAQADLRILVKNYVNKIGIYVMPLQKRVNVMV
jgi:hypothetical protein